MMAWGFLRFEMNTHKPFSICGYSFQNELGFQRDTVEEKNSLWKLVMRRATIYREPEGEVRIHIYPNLPR